MEYFSLSKYLVEIYVIILTKYVTVENVIDVGENIILSICHFKKR